MRIVVVLPTYNERENVGLLLRALLAIELRHELHIVVCDDDSPDGTADVVREVQLNASNVHLSSARRGGLGAAYVRGIRIALDDLEADVVMQMDADFSHDPSDVPRLLAELNAGADVAIGSRYVRGGTLPEAWGAERRALSRWGNRVARYLVGLHPTRDCTSGFRALRGSVLRRMPLDTIRVQGYAFLVALLYEAKVLGARIVEVPIAFTDRTRGESKLGLSDIVEFASNAVWLRLRNRASLVRFVGIGSCGVAVNIGLFTVLLRHGVDAYAASPFAVMVSILGNRVLHALTSSREERAAAFDRWSRVGWVSFLALCASYLTFVTVMQLLPGASPRLAQLAGVLPATVINYLLNAYWTSGDRMVQPETG